LNFFIKIFTAIIETMDPSPLSNFSLLGCFPAQPGEQFIY